MSQDSDEIKHDLSKPEATKNFDQKIYMFPDSYNALRKELSENWELLWSLVSYRMAYRAEEFVEIMNEALELRQVFDTENVSNICKVYLNKLRNLRGLSSL